MGNPFLDEIPDACISEEMQAQIKEEHKNEDFNRMEEIGILRRGMAERYASSRIYAEDIQTLANQYFYEMSSTEILDTYLSHFVAYSYCLEKAAIEVGKSCGKV